MAPEALFRHLQAHGVICALRGGGIRFSPHFYTPRPVVSYIVRSVDELESTELPTGEEVAPVFSADDGTFVLAGIEPGPQRIVVVGNGVLAKHSLTVGASVHGVEIVVERR